MAGQGDQASGCSLQAGLSVALFVGAYVLLVPGLIDDLFSIKAEMQLFGAAVPVLDLTKSTVGTIQHLLEMKHQVPAVLILIFSVVLPFLKLAVVLIALCRRALSSSEQSVDHLVSGIQGISKWATVDAFCVMTLAAAFSGISSSMLVIDLHLHRGFYCFLSYCILSVGAALAMPLDSSGFLPPPLFRRLPAFCCVGLLLVVLAIWVVMLWTPLIHFSIAELSFDRKLCMVSLFESLRDAGLWVPAVSFAVLVILLPGLHALLITAEELDFEVPRHVLPALGHFAMADVLLLSIVVTCLAASGLSEQLHVEVLPGGRVLLALLIVKPLMPLACAVAARQRAKLAGRVEEI